MYSSVAKDLENSNNSYNKVININVNTSDVYLMPEGAIYWYGYFATEYVNYNGGGSITLNPANIYVGGYKGDGSTNYGDATITFNKKIESGYTQLKVYSSTADFSTGSKVGILIGSYSTYAAGINAITQSKNSGVLSANISSKEGNYPSIRVSAGFATINAIWME